MQTDPSPKVEVLCVSLVNGNRRLPCDNCIRNIRSPMIIPVPSVCGQRLNLYPKDREQKTRSGQIITMERVNLEGFSATVVILD